MNYSVIKQGRNEGLVVTQDGGVASFYEQDGVFNLCLYNSHIIRFKPNSDEHWEELSNCNMYVHLYSQEDLDLFKMNNNIDAMATIALNWLCVNCSTFKEVQFSKLFNTN